MSYEHGAQTGSRRVYREIADLQRKGERAALATPVRITGSAPCSSESKLLVGQDGSTLGTIGGGLLEAQVLRQAPQVIADDNPLLLDFELTQDEASMEGMICGGSCAILIEPIRPDRAVDVYAALARVEADGTAITLITALSNQGHPEPVEGWHKLALLPDGTLIGSTGDAGADALLRERAGECSEAPCYSAQPFPVCVQSLAPVPSVYIFGGGHIALPVEQLARLVGFRTIVVDDRAEFANAERFPQADQTMASTIDEAFARFSIGADAYVVVVTRGHSHDEEVVERTLRTPARYIGMIGSRRKVAVIRQRLLALGFSEADIARLRAPIGIDIGAETVEEIAVSIVAELVAVRRG